MLGVRKALGVLVSLIALVADVVDQGDAPGQAAPTIPDLGRKADGITYVA